MNLIFLLHFFSKTPNFNPRNRLQNKTQQLALIYLFLLVSTIVKQPGRDLPLRFRGYKDKTRRLGVVAVVGNRPRIGASIRRWRWTPAMQPLDLKPANGKKKTKKPINTNRKTQLEILQRQRERERGQKKTKGDGRRVALTCNWWWKAVICFKTFLNSWKNQCPDLENTARPCRKSQLSSYVCKPRSDRLPLAQCLTIYLLLFIYLSIYNPQHYINKAIAKKKITIPQLKTQLHRYKERKGEMERKMTFAEALCSNPKNTNTSQTTTNNENLPNNNTNTVNTETSQIQSSASERKKKSTKKAKDSSTKKHKHTKSSNEPSTTNNKNKEKGPKDVMPEATEVIRTPKAEQVPPTDANNPEAKEDHHLDNSQGNNQPKAHKRATAKEKGKAKLCVDTSEYLAKLAKITKKVDAIRESSLMGYLLGNNLDFTKISTKLKSEWRELIKGEVEIIDRKHEWFEVRFSNPLDKDTLWENRPYHIFGKLVVIKPWTPTFNPLTEPLSTIDMWLRIPRLPNEYLNPEALSIILECHGLGELIRIDPMPEKQSWALFNRICVNIQLANCINTAVVIPDDELGYKEYPVWFEDFPNGCGNCGDQDHVFTKCPFRNLTPRKVQIKFRKQIPKKMEEEWVTSTHSKLKRAATGPSNPLFGVKPYLSGEGGVNIHYQSNTSGSRSSLSSSKHTSNSDNSCKISFDEGNTTENNFNMATDPTSQASPKAVSNTISQNPPYQHKTNPEPNLFNNTYCTGLIGDIILAPRQNMDSINHILEDVDNYLLDDEDFLDDEGFTDQDNLGLQKNEEAYAVLQPIASPNSYHSTHTTGSMAHKLGEMEVNNDMSTSGSSKKRNKGGEEDTATSYQKGNKKHKI